MEGGQQVSSRTGNRPILWSCVHRQHLQLHSGVLPLASDPWVTRDGTIIGKVPACSCMLGRQEPALIVKAECIYFAFCISVLPELRCEAARAVAYFANFPTRSLTKRTRRISAQSDVTAHSGSTAAAVRLTDSQVSLAMSGWTSGFSGGGRAAYQQLQHGARRVPRGVWATLQVVLLTLLLLAGVLPLWLSTVRRIKRQADDLEVLCGLYPNVNQTVVNNSYLSPSEDPRKPSDLFKVDTIYESVPVAPPPPAPPGAQPVDDAEACYRQFESYCGYSS